MNRISGLRSFAVMTAVFLVLSWLRLDHGAGGGPGDGSNLAAPDEELVATTGPDVTSVAGPEAVAAGPAKQQQLKATNTSVAGRRSTTGSAARRDLQCAAGRNGGATDTGVTADKVRLATTAVLDGPAKSLLEESVIGMKAVIDKVNKVGGVCGRLLDLTVVNDSFRADDGLRIIRNFIDEGYFALPVVPSAEGLGSAVQNGVIAKAGIPVVGTDGMRQEQYGDPYVWPVASATVTAMRVMAKYGFANREARTFALVWDSKYQFGREGKDAFVKQVEALGGDVVHTEPLEPSAASYATEVANFNGKCGDGKCDMVAMLLLPDTAKKWVQKKPAFGLRYTAGAQTLFTDRFAQDCVQFMSSVCHGFGVWTGYNPPIGPLAQLPGVARYVNDVRAVKSDVDINNQFVEGAYLGMTLFVEALKAVGPDLTRARLRAHLDAMDLETDLASRLTWRPGNHAANVRSQSFSMTVSEGTFRGWTNEGAGFVLDPAHGG